MIEIPGENDGTGLLQLELENLMPRGMSGRAQNSNGPVAESIVVAVDDLRLRRLVAAECLRNDAGGRRSRERGGQFGLVEYPNRVGEGICVAGMVEVKVRERHVGHILGRQGQRMQLLDERGGDGHGYARERAPPRLVP